MENGFLVIPAMWTLAFRVETKFVIRRQPLSWRGVFPFIPTERSVGGTAGGCCILFESTVPAGCLPQFYPKLLSRVGARSLALSWKLPWTEISPFGRGLLSHPMARREEELSVHAEKKPQ